MGEWEQTSKQTQQESLWPKYTNSNEVAKEFIRQTVYVGISKGKTNQSSSRRIQSVLWFDEHQCKGLQNNCKCLREQKCKKR